ncbi:hypothetical protein GALL_543180 [mine drainage metagenome]|uniref:Uncharacterized protein n=1 Tax=mine drainage metagenome TaxID=410659 RepID=A0A1J5P8K6_9ZZZZ
MDRHEIGPRQGGIQIGDGLAAGGGDLGGIDVGVEDQHVHVEPDAAFGRTGADAAEADDQNRLAEQIVGQFAEPGTPLAFLYQRVHFNGAFGERQHHEQCLLRHRWGIGRSHHHQRDLATAECCDIDGVVADADPCHYLHILRGIEFRFTETGGAERHAVYRRMLLQQRLEIPGSDQIGKFDEFDVVVLPQQSATGR